MTQIKGFTDGLNCKESACKYRRLKRHRFSPWIGTIRWRGNGNPLQYYCLKNAKDRGTQRAIVPVVAKSPIRLGDEARTCASAHIQTHTIQITPKY